MVEGLVTLALGVVVEFGKGLVSCSFGCVGALLVSSLVCPVLTAVLVCVVVFAILGIPAVGMGSS